MKNSFFKTQLKELTNNIKLNLSYKMNNKKDIRSIFIKLIQNSKYDFKLNHIIKKNIIIDDNIKLSDIFPDHYSMYNYSSNTLIKIKKIIFIKRFINEKNYNIIFNLDKNKEQRICFNKNYSTSTKYTTVIFTSLFIILINKFNDIKLKKDLINKNIAKQVIIGEFYSYLLSHNIDFNSKKMKLIKKLLLTKISELYGKNS